MIQKLLNHQQMPRPFGMKAGRLNAVTKSLMVLFAMLLFPQGTRALDYVAYDTNLSKFVKMTINDSSTDLIALTSTSPATTWVDGKTYYVTGSVDINDRIDVQGTVNLILCDGATLTANKGIALGENDYLNIYGQSAGTGQLTAIGQYFQGQSTYLDIHYSAIGYVKNNSIAQHTPSNYGYVNIYGGQITAFVPEDATDVDAIGGYSYKSCEVAIYGGNVTASGGSNASGINLTFLGDGVAYYGQDDGGTMSQITDETERHRYMNTKEAVYDLTIGGTQVRLTNAFNILNSENTNGAPTASFDGSTNTLELNDMQINGNIICQLDDLIVNISGTNTLCKTSGGSDGYILNNFKNNGISLNLVFEKGSADATLTLNSINNNSVIQGFTSVTAGDGIYFQYDNPFECRDVNGEYKMWNIPYNTEVQGFTITTTPHYPIWMANPYTHGIYQAYYNPNNSTTELNGQPFAATVDNTGVAAITKYTLTLKDQDLNGNHIVSNLNNLTIELSDTHTMNADSDDDPIIESLNNNATLTFAKSTSSTGSVSLEMSNSTLSTSSIISGFSNISLPSDLSWRSPDISYTGQEKKLFNGGDLAHSAILETIVGGQTGGQTIEYDVWVAGTRVNSGNALNVLNATNNNGKATVQYNATDKILTLDGATIDVDGNGNDPGAYGIKSGLANLTVELKNASSIKCNGMTDYAFEATDASLGAKVKFQSTDNTGSLNISLIDESKLFKDLEASYASKFGLFQYAFFYSNPYNYTICSHPWDGDGFTNPYLIKTLNDLEDFAKFVNDKHFSLKGLTFKLYDDITGSKAFTSIGTSVNNQFEGTFDGDNKTISGLTFEYGLFHYAAKGTIKNLTLDGCTITGGTADYTVGGLVADGRYGLNIDNCKVQNTNISCNNNNITTIGGIIGAYWDKDNNCLIKNCVVQNVNMNIAGMNTNGQVGGIAGLLRDFATIQDCVVTGTTTIQTNTSSAGALIGATMDYNASGCTYEYSVTVTDTQSGTKSGYTHRGIGGQSTDSDGAALYTKKVVLPAENDECKVAGVADTYYKVDATNNRDIYVSPNQQPQVEVTPKGVYLPTSVSTTKSTQPNDIPTNRDASQSPKYIYSFTMPDEDATVSVTSCTDLENNSLSFEKISVDYTGQDVNLPQTINMKNGTTSITLNERTHYDVTGYKKSDKTTAMTEKPKNAGTYYVTIKGDENNGYTGTVDVELEIKKITITAGFIDNIPDQTYNDGNAIKPKPTVTFNNNPLTENTDFEYEWANNINVPGANDPQPKVIVKGINNFEGTPEKTFKINKKAGSISFTTTSYNLTYGAQIFNNTVNNDGDGTVEYTSSDPNVAEVNLTTGDVTIKKAGDNITITATVKDGNNYTYPTKTATYTINVANANLSGVSASSYTGAYDGDEHSITVTAPAGATVEYCETQGGTYTLNAPKYKNYRATPYTVYYKVSQPNFNPVEGSAEVTITQRNIQDAIFDPAIADQTYDNGNAITPAFTVKFLNAKTGQLEALQLDQDFENVVYENNTNVPGANDPLPKVTISGKGNFQGTKSTNFNILPATIAAVTVSIDGWTYGEAAKSPSITQASNPGNANTVTYEYKISTEDDSKYSTTVPSNAETYVVRATVPATQNYQEASGTKVFTISKADIGNATFNPAIADQTYDNGNAITPAFTVKFQNARTGQLEALQLDQDFENVVYENNTNVPGANDPLPKVTISGKGNFQGTKSTNFNILPATIAAVTVSIDDWTYGEAAKSPSISAASNPGAANTVTYEYKISTEDDSKYSTTVPSNAETYVVRATVPATQNYQEASGTKVFTIAKADIGNATFNPSIADQTYDNGNAITPAFTVKFQNARTGQLEALQLDKDFENVVYENNTNVPGANDPLPKVTISGKGNFQGTKSTNFNILPATIAAVTVSIDDWTYGEAAKSPSISAASNPGAANTVTYEYKISTEDGGSAYNPSISAASNPGNATVTYEYKKQGAGDGTYSLTVPDAAGDYTLRATVPATQNYQGASATKDFTIAKADVNNVSISKIDALTYNGMAQAPKPDLYLGTKKLEETTDFTYGWANNTNAAQANANVAPTLTITGNGNFTGTRSVTFTINPATITDVTVDNTQFIYFPNDPKTVNVTEVKAGNLILGKNDYDVANNVKTAVGNYTLSVTGKGNFTGTLTVDWRISERVVNIDFQGRTYRTFYNASETFLIPNDVKAYIVTGVSGNTATVKEVSYIPAGTPVLLESAPGAQTTVNANEVFTGNRLKYATGPNFNAQPYYYVLYSNEFVKATGDLSGKVYLDADGLPANARTLTISHDGDATAIDALFTEEGDGEQWFDMQGRRINKPTKAGLYIRNGKKVVIKK